MPSAQDELSRPESNMRFSSQLEWDFFHVCVLQCAARFFSAADAALLAASDDAARQVSRGLAPEVRRGSGCSRRPRREIRNLAARGFGGRGRSVERSRRGAATEVPVPSRTDFDDHQHGAETRGAALRCGERFLFPLGFRLCRPALPRCSAAGTRGRRRNRILAKFSSACQAQRGSHRRDQLPHFRPFPSWLQAAPLLASKLAEEDAR